jgi:hypothetical protein
MRRAASLALRLLGCATPLTAEFAIFHLCQDAMPSVSIIGRHVVFASLDCRSRAGESSARKKPITNI